MLPTTLLYGVRTFLAEARLPDLLTYSVYRHPPVRSSERLASLRTGRRVGPGNDLVSHEVTLAVSSALARFTTVFGMGTGGTTPLIKPGPANRIGPLSGAARTRCTSPSATGITGAIIKVHVHPDR